MNIRAAKVNSQLELTFTTERLLYPEETHALETRPVRGLTVNNNSIRKKEFIETLVARLKNARYSVVSSLTELAEPKISIINYEWERSPEILVRIIASIARLQYRAKHPIKVATMEPPKHAENMPAREDEEKKISGEATRKKLEKKAQKSAEIDPLEKYRARSRRIKAWAVEEQRRIKERRRQRLSERGKAKAFSASKVDIETKDQEVKISEPVSSPAPVETKFVPAWEKFPNNIRKKSDKELQDFMSDCLAEIKSLVTTCSINPNSSRSTALLYYINRLVLGLSDFHRRRYQADWKRYKQEQIAYRSQQSKMKPRKPDPVIKEIWRFYRYLRTQISHGGYALFADTEQKMLNVNTLFAAINDTANELEKLDLNALCQNVAINSNLEHKNNTELLSTTPFEKLSDLYNVFHKDIDAITGISEALDDDFCNYTYNIIGKIANIANKQSKLNKIDIAELKILFARIAEFFNIDRKARFSQLLETESESKQCAKLFLSRELLSFLNKCRKFHKIFWEVPDANDSFVEKTMLTAQSLYRYKLKRQAEVAHAEETKPITLAPPRMEL